MIIIRTEEEKKFEREQHKEEEEESGVKRYNIERSLSDEQSTEKHCERN